MAYILILDAIPVERLSRLLTQFWCRDLRVRQPLILGSALGLTLSVPACFGQTVFTAQRGQDAGVPVVQGESPQNRRDSNTTTSTMPVTGNEDGKPQGEIQLSLEDAIRRAQALSPDL